MLITDVSTAIDRFPVPGISTRIQAALACIVSMQVFDQASLPWSVWGRVYMTTQKLS